MSRMRSHIAYFINFTEIRQWREKLSKMCLVINEELAYRNVINCINKSYHKNGGEYLRLNINGTVEQGGGQEFR